MTSKLILTLKSQGHGRDQVYEIAAGNLSLYGVAFFGHKGKPGDRAKLERVWKRIVKAFEV